MRTFAIRTLASVLAALLAASCGTVRENRQPDIEERVFLPRAPRAVASPVVEEPELRRALEELLQDVDVEEARAELRRMVVDPRFNGRRPEELHLVLASWGSGPVALEEITRGYRAFCAATQRTNCLEEPLTDSSVYEIAFDFAMGSQWDGFVGELKSTIDPSTIRIVLLTGLVIFMATLAIPELTSKIPAALATAVLTAYLGAQAVCDLIFGWIEMVRDLDAATTFDEVRAAGQRYGRLVGAQTARTLVLVATAAIGQGGLIARLMKIPRATQASAALAAETGGVGLEAVSAIKEVRVLQTGVAITVEGAARGAAGVAMASHGAPLPEPVAQTTQRDPHAAGGIQAVKVTGRAQQWWPRISAVAPDWTTKGAHIHVNGVELAVRPGQDGQIVFRAVFSGENAQAVKSAIETATRALGDIGFRQRLYNAAGRAIQIAGGGKGAELRFLMYALEKMGL